MPSPGLNLLNSIFQGTVVPDLFARAIPPPITQQPDPAPPSTGTPATPAATTPTPQNNPFTPIPAPQGMAQQNAYALLMNALLSQGLIPGVSAPALNRRNENASFRTIRPQGGLPPFLANPQDRGGFAQWVPMDRRQPDLGLTGSPISRDLGSEFLAQIINALGLGHA